MDIQTKKLYEELMAYEPYNEQEAYDKDIILTQLKEREDVFLRSDLLCHLTASGWIMDKAHEKVLMAYHNLYDSWAWLGGHADGEKDLLQVALKEAREESGISDVKPLYDGIFSVEILNVEGHVKRGAYVPSHLHLNVTYLLEADEKEALLVKEDENSAVGWFLPEDALKHSTEPWFVDHIYKKLIDKSRSLGLCRS